VLRIEKKKFDYYDPMRLAADWSRYLEEDSEPRVFATLKEAAINFPPTYPWSEDPLRPNVLMSTRPPAWCDRILMNEIAWRWVSKDAQHFYDAVGRTVCMGDHKPVLLCFSLLPNST